MVLSSPLFSPSPTLLLNPSIYFSKKAEKAARKTFSGRKGKKKTATEEQKNRRTTQGGEEIEERKVGVEENTGDEKEFRSSLWSFTTSSLFFFTPFLAVCFLGGRKLEGWDEKDNWEVGDILNRCNQLV